MITDGRSGTNGANGTANNSSLLTNLVDVSAETLKASFSYTLKEIKEVQAFYKERKAKKLKHELELKKLQMKKISKAKKQLKKSLSKKVSKSKPTTLVLNSELTRSSTFAPQKQEKSSVTFPELLELTNLSKNDEVNQKAIHHFESMLRHQATKKIETSPLKEEDFKIVEKTVAIFKTPKSEKVKTKGFGRRSFQTKLNVPENFDNLVVKTKKKQSQSPGHIIINDSASSGLAAFPYETKPFFFNSDIILVTTGLTLRIFLKNQKSLVLKIRGTVGNFKNFTKENFKDVKIKMASLLKLIQLKGGSNQAPNTSFYPTNGNNPADSETFLDSQKQKNLNLTFKQKLIKVCIVIYYKLLNLLLITLKVAPIFVKKCCEILVAYKSNIFLSVFILFGFICFNKYQVNILGKNRFQAFLPKTNDVNRFLDLREKPWLNSKGKPAILAPETILSLTEYTKIQKMVLERWRDYIDKYTTADGETPSGNETIIAEVTKNLLIDSQTYNYNLYITILLDKFYTKKLNMKQYLKLLKLSGILEIHNAVKKK